MDIRSGDMIHDFTSFVLWLMFLDAEMMWKSMVEDTEPELVAI